MLIDTFTSLDELKGRDRSDPRKILAVLERTKKFSTFDVDQRMASAMTWLCNDSGWIKTFHNHREGKYAGTDAYPWTFVEITPEGRAALKSPEHWPGLTRKKPHK